MNCIDAIEGSVKGSILRLYKVFVEDRQDDSEYIRNIKAVIEGADAFVQENKELVSSPEVLKHVLYGFAKELWLGSLRGHPQQPQDATAPVSKAPEDPDYDEYYFNYIYSHGVYPR
jgi:hypothetical protein